MMRFSTPDCFKVYMIRANKGKEKKLVTNMVKRFCENGKEGNFVN